MCVLINKNIEINVTHVIKFTIKELFLKSLDIECIALNKYTESLQLFINRHCLQTAVHKKITQVLLFLRFTL